MANRKTSPSALINTRGLVTIEQMSKAMRHAPAKAKTSAMLSAIVATPKAFAPLSHRNIREFFLLVCDPHAQAASNQSGIEITANPA